MDGKAFDGSGDPERIGSSSGIHSPVHRSKSTTRQQRVSIEASLHQVSVASPPLSGYSEDDLEPHLYPHNLDQDEGDIGYSLGSPRSPTFSRDLTSPKYHIPHSNGVPSPRAESPRSHGIRISLPTTLATPQSGGSSSPTPIRRTSSNRSPSTSPTLTPGRFKPTLPSQTMAISNVIPPPDPSDPENTPFESIPLDISPPQHLGDTSSSPNTHQASQTQGKRQSWSGYGINKESGHYAMGSSSTLPDLSTGDVRRHSAIDLAEENGQAGPLTLPPRRSAPPAHPHPYSIQSSTSGAPRIASPTAVSVPLPLPKQGKGTSVFEKVRSHTRPSWLPPKDRTEDEVHLHQWEEMMAQSRDAEAHRRKTEEARRMEKERKLALNLPRWEALLAEGDAGVARIRAGKDVELRKMWFEGIPGYLRGKAWSLALGNPLALSKDAYKMYVTRARKSLESGRFPTKILEQLEIDIDQTLPTLKLFTHGSPVRADLKEMICAWVVYRSDDGLGYAPYITHLAAMFLLTSPPSTAFLSLTNLLARPCLRAFFTQTEDEIDAYYRVFENLQAESFPKIYANCKGLGLKLPESYFRSVLVEQVPFEAACRLWDQIMLDGESYIFRAALAIFGFLEPRLYYPDRNEIESILEGRNAATLAITDREKERARLRGEAYSEDLDGRLSVFGLNEGALFGWLEGDGWKESRFERLVVREMPD